MRYILLIFRTKLAMFFVYSYICTHKKTIMRGYITKILTLVALAVFVVSGYVSAAETLPRIHYSLNDGWRFSTLYTPNVEAQLVDLPHTWSTQECSYATAQYTRQIRVPYTLRGKRLFLRFGGVMTTATVLVNGKYVGEHRGGYTAFTFEITDKLRYGENNTITVIASNNHRTDTFPLSTEHNLYGGIYRDVELMVTNKNIISPLVYSTEGIFVEQSEVTAERASGVVSLYLSAMEEGAQQITLRFVAADGYEVARYTAKAGKADKQVATEIPFSIDLPDLWSPESPTLYRVEAIVGNVDKPSDVVTVNVGFRDISISKHNRLMINGKEVDVKGVNLPHDNASCGVVQSRESLISDFGYIQDMGANALRSLVGPHDKSLYDACDREGMLAWVDMPFTRNPILFNDICYYPVEPLRENGFEQLREVIFQNYNHPSVVMWGLFSLVSQRGDDVVPYVKELNDLAHKLDKSRPTVGCSNADGDINFVTDLIVLRQDVGWSKGSYDDLRVWSRQLSENKRFRELRYGVCYGEEGCITHVADILQRGDRNARFRPERQQTLMHESYAELLTEAGIFWGMWIDNMFDYASAFRSQGMNYSGVMCFDHATKKDSYYLYRTLWNAKEPTLYIAERRWNSRCDALQTIRVYSSVGRPTLIVGRDSVELREVATCRYQADSVLLDESTIVRVVDGTGLYRDSMEIRVDKLRVAR